MNKIVQIKIVYDSIYIERQKNSHKYAGAVCLKNGKKFGRTRRIKKILSNLEMYKTTEIYYFGHRLPINNCKRRSKNVYL